MNFVNHKGEPVNLAAIAQKHQPTPKSSTPAMKRVNDRDAAKVSDGFVVLGYSPEHWSQRERDFKDQEKFTSLDEFTASWMRKNKPKRARSKPYEIESSADQCAELMRKAGWLHVRVDELMKG